MEGEILYARVNSIVGILFVASFALAMGLIVWHAVFGQNPIANAMTPYLISMPNLK